MKHDHTKYEQDYPGATLNDCAVRSIAVSAAVPMEDVAAMLEALGREPNAGTTVQAIGTACRRLGAEPVPTARRIPRRRSRRMLSDGGYGYTEQEVRPMTLAQFAKQYPEGSYVLLLYSHAVAMIDGVLHDWLEYRSRQSACGLPEIVVDTRPRRRVYSAFRLQPKYTGGLLQLIKEGVLPL